MVDSMDLDLYKIVSLDFLFFFGCGEVSFSFVYVYSSLISNRMDSPHLRLEVNLVQVLRAEVCLSVVMDLG